MNKDEIKKALRCCSAVDFETSCSDCPYCYRCNDLHRDALNIITEQENEIEYRNKQYDNQVSENTRLYIEYDKLKDDYAKLQEKFSKYQMASDKEIMAQKKEAAKELAEKLKDYINDKVVEEFNDMAADVIYLTIDIDEFEDYVDELLREYEK